MIEVLWILSDDPDPGYHDYNLMEGQGLIGEHLGSMGCFANFQKNTRIYMNCTVSLNEKEACLKSITLRTSSQSDN